MEPSRRRRIAGGRAMRSVRDCPQGPGYHLHLVPGGVAAGSLAVACVVGPAFPVIALPLLGVTAAGVLLAQRHDQWWSGG
jgi:hypothetical protein